MRPAFQVIANDQDVTDTIADRLVSIRLSDETGTKSDTLEIILADHDPANPVQIPPTGAELRVSLGYTDNMREMGLFVADEIELAGWPSEMTIRARSAVYDKTPNGLGEINTMKDRSWEEGTTLGAMVQKIASDNKLTPAIAESLAAIVLPHIDQTDESDLNFLIRVARKYDAIVKVANGTLTVAKKGESRSAGGGKPLPTIGLDAGQCGSYRVSLTKRETAGRVVAYYQDKQMAKRIAVEVGSGNPVVRLKHDYPTKAEAERAAQAQLDRRTRGERSLSLTMPGNPELTPEARLSLTGFRDGVNGEWLITGVIHDFSPVAGYSTSVEAENPPA